PIYPTGGSRFSVTGKLSIPYSLFDGVDYKALSDEYNLLNKSIPADYKRAGEIDQQRFNWLEFYKINLKGEWYAQLTKNLVLRPSMEFGFLGAYNKERGVIPFERYFLGGDGMGNFSMDGREIIAFRGYPIQFVQPLDSYWNPMNDGVIIYNNFSLELRYPITLKNSAKIYGLAFMEGGSAYSGFRNYNPFNLYRSAGLGVRIFMPAFGLLGIDFGHGFDPLYGETGSHGWETHFIIGQQF